MARCDCGPPHGERPWRPRGWGDQHQGRPRVRGYPTGRSANRVAEPLGIRVDTVYRLNQRSARIRASRRSPSKPLRCKVLLRGKVQNDDSSDDSTPHSAHSDNRSEEATTRRRTRSRTRRSAAYTRMQPSRSSRLSRLSSGRTPGHPAAHRLPAESAPPPGHRRRCGGEPPAGGAAGITSLSGQSQTGFIGRVLREPRLSRLWLGGGCTARTRA